MFIHRQNNPPLRLLRRHVLQSPAGRICAITAVSASRIWLAGEGGEIRIWSLKNFVQKRLLKEHKARVLSIARMDHNLAASGDSDGVVLIWTTKVHVLQKCTVNNLITACAQSECVLRQLNVTGPIPSIVPAPAGLWVAVDRQINYYSFERQLKSPKRSGIGSIRGWTCLEDTRVRSRGSEPGLRSGSSTDILAAGTMRRERVEGIVLGTGRSSSAGRSPSPSRSSTGIGSSSSTSSPTSQSPASSTPPTISPISATSSPSPHLSLVKSWVASAQRISMLLGFESGELWSASQDGTVCVWKAGHKLREIELSEPVVALASVHRAQYVLSAGRGFKVWNAEVFSLLSLSLRIRSAAPWFLLPTD